MRNNHIGGWAAIALAGVLLLCAVGCNDDAKWCHTHLTRCGDECVNTLNDPANCGGCDSSCVTGKACSSGKCVVKCPLGQKRCTAASGDYCADVTSDIYNCGTCGTKCELGELCSASKCGLACATGLTNCGGGDAGALFCSTLQQDTPNCGACGSTCLAGEGCAAGQC